MNPFLNTAQNVALERIGLPPSTNTATLDHATRERYTRALAEVMLQYPHNFSAQELENARARLSRADIPAPESYGIGEAVRDFTGEFTRQAESLNPLSEQNRGRFAFTLSGLAAIAVAIWAFAWVIRTSPARS